MIRTFFYNTLLTSCLVRIAGDTNIWGYHSLTSSASIHVYCSDGKLTTACTVKLNVGVMVYDRRKNPISYCFHSPYYPRHYIYVGGHRRANLSRGAIISDIIRPNHSWMDGRYAPIINATRRPVPFDAYAIAVTCHAWAST